MECGAVTPTAFWSLRMTIDIQGIMDLLPHRYPFLLIDKVVEHEPAKRLVAIKM
jgi:3-hydroxymyristoyl/3-hydroxydecanoyl-(acyl carrier protein) dehydratase